ncbi:hypothetical protein QTG54_016995, partial [Skeletonema marinoi]
MKLTLPLKKKLLKKKGGISPRQSETVSTASCSQSNNYLSDPLSPSSMISSSSSRRNNNNDDSATSVELDDGTPSHSALNDLHRVLKLIEAERHLAAHQLFTHARERIVSNATASTDTSLASARTLLNAKGH